MSESKLVELETKIMFQEDLLQELNKLVATQQEQINRLSAISKALDDRLKDVMQSLPDYPDVDQTPPHY